MGLLDNLNFSQPFRISSLLPSEAQLQAFKDKSDADAVAQFSQDPNPIRRVPFNILTALGVNPTIAQAAPTIADNAPFTGDISALADARTAFGQGDLATAGLLTAATILPGVPAGKVKGLLKKSDDTKPLLNVDDAPTEGIANVVPPTDTDSGIIAFHGSGADFDQFKLSKIGTGEGAQAFGYGLYFTDSEDIAKFYKNKISEGVFETPDGRLFDPYEPQGDGTLRIKNPNIRTSILDHEGNIEKSINRAEGIIQNNPNTEASMLAEQDLITLRNIQEKGGLKKLEGKTYKVALAPKPDELLDYDKSITEQSQKIQDALYGNEKIASFLKRRQKEDGLPPNFYSGSQFYDDLSDIMGNDANASKFLNDVGIKGIIYKADQGVVARNVPKTGKNNYVIFDENLINVLAKYGIVGGVGITALQNSDI